MATNSPDGSESMAGLAEMIQPASQPRRSNRSQWQKQNLFCDPAVMGSQGGNRRKYPPDPLNSPLGDEQPAITPGIATGLASPLDC